MSVKPVPVLEKDNTIAWVVGHRLDEQFRVQDHTRFVVPVDVDTSKLTGASRYLWMIEGVGLMVHYPVEKALF